MTLFFFAILLSILSIILLGPSLVLGLPQLLSLVIAGLILKNITMGFVEGPLLTELIESITEKHPKANEDRLSEQVAGLVN